MRERDFVVGAFAWVMRSLRVLWLLRTLVYWQLWICIDRAFARCHIAPFSLEPAHFKEVGKLCINLIPSLLMFYPSCFSPNYRALLAPYSHTDRQAFASPVGHLLQIRWIKHIVNRVKVLLDGALRHESR